MKKEDKKNRITSYAKSVTKLMIKENIIEKSDEQYMVYAVELLIEKVMFFLSILLLSLCMKKLIETILFLLVFCTLRKYTGGFHFNRLSLCYFMSILSYISIIYGSTILCATKYGKDIVYFSTILAIIIILMVGTVNHPNMNLNDFELCQSKNRARIWGLFIGVSICLLMIFEINMNILVFPCIGVILCAMLQLIAKLIGQEVKGYGKDKKEYS